MKLNNENYFSPENNMKYMSVSQFKSFMKCEAAALAEVKGEYERKKTAALLVGSYIDAFFEGALEKFKTDNPCLFTKQGGLKSEYKQADAIIERIKEDSFFMKYMAGEKQVIQTGELFGVPFKTKIDSYHPGKAIVDLKIMRDFQPVYLPEQGRANFIEAWGYDLQGAVYQAIEGNYLPFYIAAATKEEEPDIAVISVPQAHMDACMEIVKANVHRFSDLKKGFGEPIRCEKCSYCRRTKKLDRVVTMEEFDDE